MQITALLKKRSILLTWLVSYLVFLFIFLAASMLIYSNTEKIVQEEMFNTNSLLLNNLCNSMDNIIMDVSKISRHTTTNTEIQKLTKLNTDLQDSDYFDIYLAIKSLASYRQLNSNIKNAYVVLKDINKVIALNGVYSTREFYDFFYSNNENDYLSWLKVFDEKTADKFYLTNLSNGNQVNRICYIKAISPYDLLKLSHSIVFEINNESLEYQLRSIDKINKGISFVLDDNNKIIAASTLSHLPGDINTRDLNGSSGRIVKTIDSQKFVISYISSAVTSWKYITIVDEDVFLQKAKYVRNVSYWIIGFSVSICFILALYFLKKNYNPVSKLLKTLKENVNPSVEKSSNEYTVIENIIKKTLEHNSYINKELTKQKVILKENLLERLLKGNIKDPASLKEALQSYSIEFASDNFMVLLFYLESYYNDLETSSLNYEKELEDFPFIISNVIEELISKKSKIFFHDVDGIMTCLISIHPDELYNAKSEIFRIAEEAQRFIQIYFHVEITFSASTIHKDIPSISSAYIEAVYAMNYKNILNIRQGLSYDDIAEPFEKLCTAGSKQFSPDFKNNSDDFKAEKYCDKKNQATELAQFLMVKMLCRTAKSTGGNRLNPINKIIPYNTIVQMRLQFEDILKSFLSNLDDSSKQSPSWVITDVIPYIHQNFTNPDLSLSHIADQFHVHSVHLSKTFKAQLGIGLLDYITRLRVEKSKALLKERKECTIEAISEAVGYLNVHSFTRVFKKCEGVPPGQFRESQFI